VTFWGAAQSVTGSMHLVEAAGQRILLDCGLTRGPRDEARERNRQLPFDPLSLDAVVLSHAHVDHCGNLPNLIRQGYQGPIYCTPATRDLIEVMLHDSARIQEEDAQVAAVAGRAGHAARTPLYTRLDAADAVAHCIAVSYSQEVALSDNVLLRFTDAGHILGSAMATLTVRDAGRDYRITFTGDLGRRGLPYLRDPSPVPEADLIISESTYGGKTHQTVEEMARIMADVVKRTAARGGKVLIPAFSLGRTQLVLHFLQRWMREGLLPQLPLYVDSPLAHDISHVYSRYPECFPHASDDGPPLHYLQTQEASREVSQSPEPCIIVASGGMCEGGRITQHLRVHLDDPRAALVLVSYQAPHTVGHQLLQKRPTVHFQGRKWNKWLEVVELKGFSGHADHNDFLALLGPLAGRARHVRLVHGEPEQAHALADALRERGFEDVEAPRREEAVRVA
jgi:metallo-beta-lactamase family protein